MRDIVTPAIVLATADVFDADRRYLIFTEHLGKVMARARGVRKPGSRLAGHLLRFLPTTVTLQEQNGFYLITQAQTTAEHRYPEDPVKFLREAELLTEAIDGLLENNASHPEIFDGIVGTIAMLQDGTGLEHLVVAELLWKCLSVLGYRPELQNSVMTGSLLDAENLVWSSEMGGLANASEMPQGSRFIKIDNVSVAKVLRQFSKPAYAARKLTMPPDVARAACEIIFNYVQESIGKPLKALSV